MSPGGADRYADLEIRIVKGHNPDLVLSTGERFDLTAYATEEALHTLMIEQGFVLRGDTSVQNKNPKCYAWRNMGECVANPTFMREECALACRNLADRNDKCAEWAHKEECEKNPKFMNTECPVACGWKEEL